MRALGAILIIVCLCASHAHYQSLKILPRVLNTLLGNNLAIRRILTCTQTLGPGKCLNALSAYRADRALETFAKKQNAQFNLTEDVEQFDWKRYSNITDEQLHSQLCDGTQRLLEHRSLMLDVQGYKVQLESNRNGTISLDVYKSNVTESGRGSSKKMKKAFYKIVPFLLLPGLLMSAVLPFVLPALKLMTVAVGILNNMALTGAVFTLLRNNAFSDYKHKILYVNAGYKNAMKDHDEHAEVHDVHAEVEPAPVYENYDTYYGDSNLYENIDHNTGDFYKEKDLPVNSNWISQFYGDNINYAGVNSVKRKDIDKREPDTKKT